MQELMAKERLVGEIAVRPVLEEGEVARPGRKAAGAGHARDVRRGADDAEAHAGRVAPPPHRRRPRDRSAAPAAADAAAAGDAGDHDTGTATTTPAPPSGPPTAAARSRRHSAGATAPPQRRGTGRACRLLRPRPLRPPRPSAPRRPPKYSVSAVICRTWRTRKGRPGRGLSRVSLPLVAAGAAAETPRAVQRNGGDRRVGPPGEAATAYNVYRGEELVQPVESGAVEGGVVRATGVRSARSSAIGCAASSIGPADIEGRGVAAAVRDAARQVPAGRAERAGGRADRRPDQPDLGREHREGSRRVPRAAR